MPGKVVSQGEWVAARKAFLQKEKDLTRASDALVAERRELPMVKVEKDYKFKGANGSTLSLEDLFGGKEQLLVYHFMFSPEAEEGCRGCTFLAEHIPDLRHLRSKNTAMVVVSRGPFEKLEAYKNRIGWTFPWYSSEGSDFNYDFDATLDDAVKPIEYNYTPKAEIQARKLNTPSSGEAPGLSVFLRQDGDIYHTYSTYARGLEPLVGTMQLLDLTPLGRQDGATGPEMYKRKYEYEDGA